MMESLISFRSGDEYPVWAKDGLTARTEVRLSFRDRLKVLFGYLLEVETFTATENPIGQTETRAVVRVYNARRKVLGVADGESRLCECIADCEQEGYAASRVPGRYAWVGCPDCGGGGVIYG